MQTSIPGTPWLQRLLPRRALTRFIYRVTRIRLRWVKNLTIRGFVRAYKVDTDDALEATPNGFDTFNAFFTRALVPGARPLAGGATTWCSPCDGRVSEFGPVTDEALIQAKGMRYSLDALLAGSRPDGTFSASSFATIYLAPYNYHRVHCPFDGELVCEVQAGHDLYSVSPATVASVGNLFVENERRIMLFRQADAYFAVILVGALNVGSITTVTGGEVQAGRARPDKPSKSLSLSAKQHFKRGDLLGWFNMGSTVIIVAENALFDLSPTLRAGTDVRMGEELGRLPNA